MTIDRARRRFVHGAALALAWPAWPARAADVPPGVQTVANLLAAWDALGWQWTGSDIEDQSARWLASVASGMGLDVEVQSYPFQRTDVEASSVEVGVHRAPGLPLFDGGSTAAAGIEGPLALVPPDGTTADPAASGAIGVIELAPTEAHAERLAALRGDGRYVAGIVITQGGEPGLAPLDVTDPDQPPSGKPIVQISSEARDWLRSAAQAGATARVVARMTRNDAQGRNVVAVVTGTDATLRPLVVVAGRSGWGPCVGERGGGLVAWIEAAALLAREAPARTAILVATSGCELGDLGLARFLARYPKLANDALAWIELGPNLGARDATLSIHGSQEALVKLFSEHLSIEGAANSAAVKPGATQVEGALRLEGSASKLYHLPRDQLPSAVRMETVVAIAKGVGLASVELSRSI